MYCSGVSHVGISDHSLIYVFRKIALPSFVKGSRTISYRQFKNFDCNRFRSDILAQPWTDLMRMDNPNEMCLKWKSLFLEVCDLHAPFRTKHVRASKSPWITSELKNLMYWRDRLKIKALRTGDVSDCSNFKKLRNEVNNSIKKVKKSYYYRTGIAEVTGSNPVEALIFFRLLLSNCLNWKIYCDDHSSL